MSRAGLCVNNIRHATKFWRGPPRRRKGDASELENTIISLKDIAVSFDGEQVLKSFNLDIRGWRICHAAGPFRVREDHRAADDWRLHHTGFRRGLF